MTVTGQSYCRCAARRRRAKEVLSAVKVLIATAVGQGQSEADYCWTTDGELVRLYDCPDDYCRCSGFGGIESHKGTSTAQVVERPDLDPSTLLQLFRRDMENQGYAQYLTDEEINESIVGELAEFVMALRDVSPGEIVERWGSGIRVRRGLAA
jgi:hypothetical protein